MVFKINLEVDISRQFENVIQQKPLMLLSQLLAEKKLHGCFNDLAKQTVHVIRVNLK
jgi:hypothetical protein